MWSTARTRRLAARAAWIVLFGVVAAAAACVKREPEPARVASLTLGTAGRAFTVNGTPRFLLFVSYFDALRRANAGGANVGDLTSDLLFFRAHGIDGIRIFPNWQYLQANCRPDAANVSDDEQKLFKREGGINEAMWPVLTRVLDLARQHYLVVDVSFSRETYATPIPVPAFTHTVVEVAERLKGDVRYRHVMFDVQNEFDQGRQLMTAEEAVAIVNAIHQPSVDPLRLASASGGSGGIHGGMDFVAFHDPREPGNWFTLEAIRAQVKRIEADPAATGPIYFQEPMPFAPSACGGVFDGDPAHTLEAARHAQEAGVAAWTFHTRQSFDLSQTTLQAILGDGPQKTAIETLSQFRSVAIER